MTEQLRQELLMAASEIHQQAKDTEEKLSFIETQISELEEFTSNLDILISTEEKESISSLGKGVYLKTEIKEKKLFIQVGSGIVVRKTPEEAKQTISSQLQKLKEAKTIVSTHFDLYHARLKSIVEEIEAMNK